MNADAQHGRCPRCMRPGVAREPCMDDACARLGVHRLPEPYGETPTQDPAIGRLFDIWLVLARLGEGAMGAVYLAEQQPLRLKGALKLVTRGGGTLAEEGRFVREASALSRLTHPNIVRLLAYGMAQQPYLVMEYLEGGRTLRDVMPELDVADRRRVLVQITHALEAAHAQGVVHRDLKPTNVMVQSVAGERFFVRLVDFGLAKFTDDGDRTTVAAGSPRYMAPEQATQRAIGPWTDVYALGVMACEMLAEHLPFGEGSVQAILVRKMDPAHDPLSNATRPVPGGLAGFLRRAMASDPEGRFPDAAAMRAALPPVEALELPETRLVGDGLAATAPLLEATAPAAAEEREGRASSRGRMAWAGLGLAVAGGALALAFVGTDGEPPAAPDTRSGVDAALTAPREPAVDAAPLVERLVDARIARAPVPDAARPESPPDAHLVAADAGPRRPDRGARRPRTTDAPRPTPSRPPATAARPTRDPAAQPAPTRPAGSLQMDDSWTKEKTP